MVFGVFVDDVGVVIVIEVVILLLLQNRFAHIIYLLGESAKALSENHPGHLVRESQTRRSY